MKNSFEQIPTNKPEEEKKEIKERLKKSSEKLAEVEKELMEKHIQNLIREVVPQFTIDEETLSNLSGDEELVKLSEEILRLENQSQTTIEEGGYTNEEKAKLYRGQLASLAEKKVNEIKKEKAA